VLDAVVKAGRLDEPARGIAFVLAVEEVTGIVHRET
jgi:nitrogen regulatory protein P-II 1